MCYYGQWCDGLAIDNFKVYGDVPLNTSFDWTSVTPVAAFQDFACTTHMQLEPQSLQSFH